MPVEQDDKPLDEYSVRKTMDCARQIVRAYGPADLPQSVRDALCAMMTHYETAAFPK